MAITNSLKNGTPFGGIFRREILLGKRTGWMHGVVEYDDVFGAKRHTWFTFGITRVDEPSDHPDALNVRTYVAEVGNLST